MNRLFLILIALTAILVLGLPFVAWYFVDHGRGAQAFVTVCGWVGLLAYLLVRGAN